MKNKIQFNIIRNVLIISFRALKDSGNWPKEFIYKQCSEYKDNTNGGDIQVDLRSALRVRYLKKCDFEEFLIYYINKNISHII